MNMIYQYAVIFVEDAKKRATRWKEDDSRICCACWSRKIAWAPDVWCVGRASICNFMIHKTMSGRICMKVQIVTVTSVDLEGQDDRPHCSAVENRDEMTVFICNRCSSELRKHGKRDEIPIRTLSICNLSCPRYICGSLSDFMLESSRPGTD